MKTSVFELFYVAEMNKLLQPAFLSLVPEWEWKHECFAVLTAIVESLYLRENSASFSEHFYGLKRTNLNGKIGFCVLSLVMAPYISSKLESDHVQIGLADLKLKQIYDKARPYIEYWSNALHVAWMFAYSIGLNKYPSPWFGLLGMELVFKSSSDLVIYIFLN